MSLNEIFSLNYLITWCCEDKSVKEAILVLVKETGTVVDMVQLDLLKCLLVNSPQLAYHRNLSQVNQERLFMNAK